MPDRKTKSNTVLSLFGLIPMRIGGTERYCFELSRALEQNGWRSVLGFEGNMTPLVRNYLQGPNVAFENLPSLTTGGIKMLWAVRRLLKKYRPEIVHFQYTGFVTPIPWLAKFSGARQVYFTCQASYPEGFEPRKTHQPKRILARVINAPLNGVVCPSDFGRRCLMKTETLFKPHFWQSFNGTHLADLSRSAERSQRFRNRFGISEQAILVTQVGQLIFEKGVVDLLTAFCIASAKNENVHLVLVGDGPERRSLEKLIDEWHLKDRVTLTGLIEDIDDSGVFEACDICCLMSRWEELFGFVLVEAMARSKPVVATRVGGIPEVVLDSKTGYLLDRGDTQGVAARLLELAAQPLLRDRMGRAGRERVGEYFDVRTNVLQVLDLYGIK